MANLVSAVGGNVRNAVCAARRELKLSFKEAPVVRQDDHGDNLYRVQLATGDVVEVTCKRHARAEATILDRNF